MILSISGFHILQVCALKKCITDMLSLPGQAPIYIIVDGLDECPNFPNELQNEYSFARHVMD
jgi:hypothetical protein